MRKRNKTPLREKIADAMELPKEIALSMPRISLLAGKEATVENYKGVIELGRETIRLYTSAGIVTLCGEEMDVTEITDEDITISGIIRKIELE